MAKWSLRQQPQELNPSPRKLGQCVPKDFLINACRENEKNEPSELLITQTAVRSQLTRIKNHAVPLKLKKKKKKVRKHPRNNPPQANYKAPKDTDHLDRSSKQSWTTVNDSSKAHRITQLTTFCFYFPLLMLRI